LETGDIHNLAYQTFIELIEVDRRENVELFCKQNNMTHKHIVIITGTLMERRKYFEVFFNQNNMTHTVSLLFHACDYKYWQSIIPHENYKITIERICNMIS
jgi:hypothetical protein